jgi:hypothetical protein
LIIQKIELKNKLKSLILIYFPSLSFLLNSLFHKLFNKKLK